LFVFFAERKKCRNDGTTKGRGAKDNKSLRPSASSSSHDEDDGIQTFKVIGEIVKVKDTSSRGGNDPEKGKKARAKKPDSTGKDKPVYNVHETLEVDPAVCDGDELAKPEVEKKKKKKRRKSVKFDDEGTSGPKRAKVEKSVSEAPDDGNTCLSVPAMEKGHRELGPVEPQSGSGSSAKSGAKKSKQPRKERAPKPDVPRPRKSTAAAGSSTSASAVQSSQSTNCDTSASPDVGSHCPETKERPKKPKKPKFGLPPRQNIGDSKVNVSEQGDPASSSVAAGVDVESALGVSPKPKKYAVGVYPKPKQSAVGVSPKPNKSAVGFSPKPKKSLVEKVSPKAKTSVAGFSPKPTQSAVGVSPKPQKPSFAGAKSCKELAVELGQMMKKTARASAAADQIRIPVFKPRNTSGSSSQSSDSKLDSPASPTAATDQRSPARVSPEPKEPVIGVSPKHKKPAFAGAKQPVDNFGETSKQVSKAGAAAQVPVFKPKKKKTLPAVLNNASPEM